MKIGILFLLLSLLVLSSGCTRFPERKEDQATYYIENAESELTRDPDVSCRQIAAALSLPTGGSKVKSFFIKNELMRSYCANFLQKKIENIRILDELRNIYNTGVLDQLSVIKQEKFLMMRH